jgi:hypothetical protein
MTRMVLLIAPLTLTLAGCSEFGMTPMNTAGDAPLDTASYAVDEDAPFSTPSEETWTDTGSFVAEDTGEPAPEDDCDETSDLVYVIDRDQESLYLFDPMTLSFAFLGDLDCGTFSGTPASMSVSRDGIAYVRYSDDTVYGVNLETMNCQPTSYNSNFGSFGMGYSTKSEGTWQDDLYISNTNQVAKLDTNTWNLTPLGQLPSQSELTGNADGELWAMLPLEVPAALMQIDTTTGNTVQKINLSGMPNPMNIDTFAFATWGGDFWLFIRENGMGESTNVYKVASSGAMNKVAVDTGMNVVGAGVSTCAPTE